MSVIHKSHSVVYITGLSEDTDYTSLCYTIVTQ